MVMRRHNDAVSNVDERTVHSFGKEWTRFDQAGADEAELTIIFEQYFSLFPWDSLPKKPVGLDVGCGSGRWARFVAPRVGTLHCLDASADALGIARENLRSFKNVVFHLCSVDSLPFNSESMDFAYSLGVLHHVPDPQSALSACVAPLKKGAPFLVYLYYAMEQRPWWFRALWRFSNRVRQIVAWLPPGLRDTICDALAALIYWPLARLAQVAESLGWDASNFPLASYRNRSFYTMRTDARDRFGTPLERRFTGAEVIEMMESAGLDGVRLSDKEPFWCAIGFKR